MGRWRIGTVHRLSHSQGCNGRCREPTGSRLDDTGHGQLKFGEKNIITSLQSLCNNDTQHIGKYMFYFT